MKRQKQSSQRASRMDRYVPLIREFAARSDDFALEFLNAVEQTQVQPMVETRR